jgi:hypothetical protein
VGGERVHERLRLERRERFDSDNVARHHEPDDLLASVATTLRRRTP